jgi:hypothetical protein
VVADPAMPLDGPARVLVTYASRMGSTAEIGEAIAERLRAADLDVNVVPVGQAPEQFRGRAARPSWGGADLGRIPGRCADAERR